ncbi:hypothetical protein OS493_024298 [Desmophyllum pertusum]|uniref:Integrase core domain-containing protein n=1 Tax=Desmophyllum pertusum TaxID=174260 RepID=A0A9X0CQF2_9CNID|nr:hypothetical protein OS493_024298 [Desmophyllum pertusum]
MKQFAGTKRLTLSQDGDNDEGISLWLLFLLLPITEFEHYACIHSSDTRISSDAPKALNGLCLVVSRETVRHALKVLDPDGVERRSRHKLKRRTYSAKGPSYIWHLDGYDKLKPFGLCIHGAIDGYSRRILWLEVGTSNNNPRIVARYFLDCAKQLDGVPRTVRGDRGTENVNVAAMQTFFRRNGTDSMAGEKSFLYGRSVSNQRIEAWWSFLRKNDTDWWINFFKDLRDVGLYCDDDPLHVECLRFCFIPLLQEELNRVAQHWNLHQIRPSLNQESPPGRPDVLYFLPELQGASSYLHSVDDEEMSVAEELCCDDRNLPADETFIELAQMVMDDNNLQMPITPEEASTLYSELLYHIET